jgi:hypothetical protein
MRKRNPFTLPPVREWRALKEKAQSSFTPPRMTTSGNDSLKTQRNGGQEWQMQNHGGAAGDHECIADERLTLHVR